MPGPLRVEDIRDPATYEAARSEEQQHLVAVRRPRRVPLGDAATLVFENRATLRGAVEERLRVDGGGDPGRIAAEVSRINALLPAPGELVALVTVEVTDAAALSGAIAGVAGVASALRLRIGDDHEVPAVPEPDLAATAVPVVRFHVGPDRAADLEAGPADVILEQEGADPLRVALDDAQRAALAEDLRG